MSRRIRFRSQVELADCGAACLAMALEFHGRPVPLDEVRTICGTGRDGTDALAIVEASAYYGLDARGVRAEIEDLEALPTATLLFWDMSHFVLLEDVKRRGIVIVDPAAGRRFVKWDNVDKSYAGVAILAEPGEDFVPGGTRTRGLTRYLRPLLAQHDALRRVVVISLLLRVLLLSLPLLVAALVDRVVPTGDRSLLRVIALSLVVMVSVQLASSWIRGRLLIELRTRVDQKMTIGFLEHLVALPYTFHLRRSSGDLMMRLRINSAVRELLTSSTLSALLDGSFAVLYLILLLGVSFKLGLVVLGLGAAQVVVLILSRRATQRLASEGLQAEARSQGYAFQLLSGIETLKASGAEPRAVERFSGLFTDELAVSLARGRLSALVEAVMGALSAVSPLVVLTVAGLQVLDGRISLGTALAVNALASSFLGPLSALVSTGLSVQVLTGYVERLNDVFDTPREQEGEEVAPAPRLSGSITLERVSFRYTPLAPLVVRDVSVHIEPGMKVALVGRSGSGKTTLGHLLLGLYRPTTGRLLYDGLDLAGLEARSVRSQFGVVTQDPYLFATSIRENIAFGDPEMGLEPVRHAARLACVAEDIEVLPLGYDTVLGDGGSSLSGGQRQRLALARALATNPSVLLLDEATSHLDAVTESDVQKQIEKLGATTIIVAHRLSTVAKADLILVLDGGRVVERGTHKELLAQGGAYAELVHSQLDSETGEVAPKAVPAPRKRAPAKPKKVAAATTPKPRATASTTRRTRSTS